MHFSEEISSYIPEKALPIVKSYWKQHPFSLKISRERRTKSGDYRFIPEQKGHLISVNQNLNSYQFLFTLIHEIAHQWVKIHYKRRQAPHGSAWKKMFRELLDPLLQMDVFPPEMARKINEHMRNPKASTAADHGLYQVMQNGDGGLILNDVPEGSKFRIGKRLFIKGPKRRSRFLCYALPDKRKYTVSAIAPIELESADAA
jgi:predicted SprT family Zn-dependent metalloprotease